MIEPEPAPLAPEEALEDVHAKVDADAHMDVDLDADVDMDELAATADTEARAGEEARTGEGAAASAFLFQQGPGISVHPVALAAPAELSETDAVIYAFRRNVVVAASAGTGKTHRLTALYLLLTLGLTSSGQAGSSAAPPILPDRIVATTFSRAAAREIMHRIEQALRRLATWNGRTAVPFGDVLLARQAALGVTIPPATIRQRAAEALGRWGAARIDTLHGVAKQIVDRHAIAMGLTPGARILDEEEAQALSDLAVDEVLSAALAAGGERADAARALLAATGGIDAARAQITRLLDRLDEEGLTPRRLAPADHAAEARRLRRELARLAAQCAAAGNGFAVPAAAVASALASGRSSSEAASRATPTGADPEPSLARAAVGPVLDLLKQRRPPRSKCTPADEELCAFRDDLPGKTHADKAHRFVGFLREAGALERREALLVELLEEVRERLATIRRTEGGLGFGDLLRAARDGLRDDPAIGRAVRDAVDVLLVDEFQDTSSVQRDLVYLLRERDDAAEQRPPGAAPGAASLKEHGLFLVGDRKQSIYGFRGADVSVFCRVCAELAGAAAARALELSQASPTPPIADFVALRESHRSAPEVLAFINAFSARDFSQGRGRAAEPGPSETASPPAAPAPLTPPLRDFEIAYSAAEHLVPAAPLRAAPATPPQVVFIADAGDADNPGLAPSPAPESADALVREARGPLREALLAAAYVARRVRGAHAGDLHFRDIAVLARRRSTIPLIELALARLEIPYVVAGRALYDAPEIRDVAALLRLVLDPRDRLALATVLRGPMVALSDTSLALLSTPGRGLSVPLFGRWVQPDAGARDRDEPVAPALARLPAADRARLDAFRARFPALRRAALRSSPGEAIRAAVAAFDLDRVLAALPRAEARIGNIDRLVSIARRRGGSLAGFVRWLDRRIRDEADEPEAAVFSAEDDAVRLTTIHGSKGLDFPAVIALDLNAEPRGDLPGLGFLPAAQGGGSPGGASAPPAERPAALIIRHYARRVDRAPRPGSRYDAAVEALAPLFPISTPALQAAAAEVRARDRAERQRLTYVAITRARRELVLIGAAARPRNGSAWQTLKTGIDAGALEGVLTTTLEAHALLAEARPPAPGTDAYARPAPPFKPAPPPQLAAARTVAIAAAPLALFQTCPRRFRLRHLLGLEEPASAGQLGLFDLEGPAELPGEERAEIEDGADPRPPGRAAHRALERWPRARWGEPTQVGEVVDRLAREGLPADAPEALRLAQGIARFLEGPYARRVRDRGAALLREEAFVLVVEPSSEPRHRHGVSLAMRGAIDLVVELPEGIDVIEYRRARPRSDLSAYELPLRACALAMTRRYPERPVRAGVLFLGSHTEPVWLKAGGARGRITDEEHARFEQRLLDLAEQLAEARRSDRFEGAAVETCRRLRCGFLEACHGERDKSV